MTTKRRDRPTSTRTSVHVLIDADIAKRLRAFAGFSGREMGDVVTEGLRHVLKGFSVRQEPQSERGRVSAPSLPALAMPTAGETSAEGEGHPSEAVA